MRSKQLNFFITEEEYSKVQEFLLNDKILIKKRRYDTVNIYDYDLITNPDSIFQVYLTNDNFQNNLIYEYMEEKNYYYMDIEKSYAIEFSIGGFYPYSDKDYHSSRLYVINKYFENRLTVSKPDEFIEWCDDILKKFKERFLQKKDPSHITYTSAKFDNWVQKTGAKLSKDGSSYIFQKTE